MNFLLHLVHDFDIFCFTERYLDSKILISNIVIEGFNSPFRKDRNSFNNIQENVFRLEDEHIVYGSSKSN